MGKIPGFNDKTSQWLMFFCWNPVFLYVFFLLYVMKSTAKSSMSSCAAGCWGQGVLWHHQSGPDVGDDPRGITVKAISEATYVWYIYIQCFLYVFILYYIIYYILFYIILYYIIYLILYIIYYIILYIYPSEECGSWKPLSNLDASPSLVIVGCYTVRWCIAKGVQGSIHKLLLCYTRAQLLPEVANWNTVILVTVGFCCCCSRCCCRAYQCWLRTSSIFWQSHVFTLCMNGTRHSHLPEENIGIIEEERNSKYTSGAWWQDAHLCCWNQHFFFNSGLLILFGMLWPRSFWSNMVKPCQNLKFGSVQTQFPVHIIRVFFNHTWLTFIKMFFHSPICWRRSTSFFFLRSLRPGASYRGFVGAGDWPLDGAEVKLM